MNRFRLDWLEVTCGCLISAFLLAASGSASTDVEPFVDLLAGVESDGLKIEVEGGARTARLGQSLAVRIDAREGGHLLILQLDAHGGLRVISPDTHPMPRWVDANQSVWIDDLPVSGPVGPVRIYAVTTPRPSSLEVARGFDETAGAGRSQAGRLGRRAALEWARRIRKQVQAGGAVASAALRFVGGEEVEYTAAEIVRQLVPTRAIRRPRIDFHHVLFDFDSATLTETARKNLDVLAEALSSPELEEERFVFGGHTDDVGRSQYNQALSERRAHSAREYLSERWEIDRDRLVVRGYGEERPLEEGRSPESRRMNRRVELEVIR